MLKFAQDITVDLNVELTNNVLNSIHVNQYEHKSREINIYVKKDGIDYPIPNNLTVNIRIHKSNGYDIYKTIGKDIGAINGNIITIIVDESMTIAHGRQTCDIEFIDSNNNRLYSTKFYINVHKSALDDNNIKDNDDYSTVQSLARESKEYANLSESYAVGTNNEIRENDSIDNAKYYKEQSEINADNTLQYSENAKTSANNADSSAINAQKSEIASKTSEQNAKASEVAAKESETNSKSSENASKISETNASNSASISTEKAIAASDYADNAANSAETAEEAKSSAEEAKNTATSKASEAATSADNASRDAQQSANSARQASESAMTASDKASQATDSAAKAESFAHGGTDTRENEDIDNAKYYYEQAKSISESFSGSLRPMGTINFSLFVDTVMSTATEGDMYNISDEFTTNANFKEGSGLTIPAGANIYKTTDGMWDVLAGSPVTSVNSMRGNVNITPASIKALPDTTKYAGSDSIGGAANTAMQVNGTYTGSGGQQPPSYVTSGKTRFNMWNAFKGIANPAGGYMDVILMDNYTGQDVPSVTAIGVTKNYSINPRMFVANGQKGSTGNWSHQVEVITTANISSQTVGSATKATQDGNGKVIASTYLPLTGGTLTGVLSIKSQTSILTETGSTIRLSEINSNGSETVGVQITTNGILVVNNTAGGINAQNNYLVTGNNVHQHLTANYLPKTNGIVKGTLYWENTDWEYTRGLGITDFRDARSWGQSYLYVGTKNGAFSIAWTASDEALKKNIKKSREEALNKIQEIDFIEYDWKNEKLGHVDLGISANQLENIIPGAVFHVKQPEDSEHEYIRNLNSQELTIYALKGIQELYDIVLAQREIIEQLRNERKE